ncbi:hypothetical protein RD792_005230 [Penstemon davidsonii]|uniref:Pectinesterase n=1 Tax=Penstemon davidsonii TaxID=160366 RepID=A0ABR0DJN0_9LAMI|nr:hypothetical protein RD792_005230 [Penstemon davidsonii]
MAVRGIIVTVAVVLILAATSVTVFMIKHKNKPQKPSPDQYPTGVLWYNATVSKSRQGAYRTITEALAAAPAYSVDKYYIHIEAGLYEERVIVSKTLTNIVFVGDGEEVTKISGSRRYPEFPTIDTATVDVQGDGFIAKFITFENSGGDGSSDSQAVALLSTSYQSAFYKCTFLGYQDTLYAKKGTQFYRECSIYGTVDFIFGAAAAVFQSCNLYSRLPRLSTITAQNRDEFTSQSGFVLQNCTLTVAPGLELQKSGFEAYLGRPWSNYSTVIVMESFLDSIIPPVGWLSWEGRTTDALTYREFGNRGPGASTSGRVSWQGFKAVTLPNEMLNYTVGELIDGTDWLRHTGIPNTRGFIYE